MEKTCRKPPEEILLSKVSSLEEEKGDPEQNNRNILEDWARKTSLEIVRVAKKLGYAVAREDLTGLINSLRKIKNKDHRTKLIIMGYSRLVKWINWQAMKHGVPLAIVSQNGT
jgi:IS605 OrfB family transposase